MDLICEKMTGNNKFSLYLHVGGFYDSDEARSNGVVIGYRRFWKAESGTLRQGRR